MENSDPTLLATIMIFVIVFLIVIARSRIAVPPGSHAILQKRFSLKRQTSRHNFSVVSLHGGVGIQATTLKTGNHWGYFPLQYSYEIVPFVHIPPNEIAIVSARDGTPMPEGAILGTTDNQVDFSDAGSFLENGGIKGRQAKVLRSGVYSINYHLFDVFTTQNVPEGIDAGELCSVRIGPKEVGIVTTFDGEPLAEGQIAGKPIQGHRNYQDADSFINGGGQKGLQEELLMSGDHFINPWFASVEITPMITIAAGIVGVVVSNVGEYEEGRDGHLVGEKGKRGIQQTPLLAGTHAVNVLTHRIQPVPVYDITLEWSDIKKDPSRYDAELRPLRLRSKDGFEFTMEISQVIRIKPDEAPILISQIGVTEKWSNEIEFGSDKGQKFSSVRNLITRLLKPFIEAHFRNVAQTYGVKEFQSKREQLQAEAAEAIREALAVAGVVGVRTNINEIELPQSVQDMMISVKLTEEEINLVNVRKKLEVEKAALLQREAQTEGAAELEKAKYEEQAANIRHKIELEKIEREVLRMKGEFDAAGGIDRIKFVEISKALGNIVLPQIISSSDGGVDLTQLVTFRMLTEMLDESEGLSLEKKAELKQLLHSPKPNE